MNDRFLNTTYPFGKLTGSLKQFPLIYPRFPHVIHVIRNPLKQISSVTAHTNKTYAFIEKGFNRMLQEKNLFENALIHPKELASVIQNARSKQKHCFRGGKCHLEFSVISWIYWNRYVAR
jgi:hypothetical protein